MKKYTLKNHLDNAEIFSGLYSSFTDCLEDAVFQGIDLSSVDLRQQNLSNANLDGAIMPNAHFAGANLTGANLSEANLRSSIFFNASLHNCCFSFSIMNGVDFRMALFGGTMINGISVQNAMFSNMSCFDLDFSTVRNMEGSYYITEDGKMHKMSQPPLIIKGALNAHIIVLDQTVRVGFKDFPKNLLPQLLKMVTRRLVENEVQENPVSVKQIT